MKQEDLAYLWEKVCAEDRAAFASLHKKLYQEIKVHAIKIIQDEDAAEDLVQDLFFKLWLKKSQIGRIENVKAYLYRAIRSLSLNYLRRITLKNRYQNSFLLENETASIEDHWIANENAERLRKRMYLALEKLPSRQKEIIDLTFYNELSYPQVVKQTGIRYQSVVNHVHRAVKLLRRELIDEKAASTA